jgi:hypothetical protein
MDYSQCENNKKRTIFPWITIIKIIQIFIILKIINIIVRIMEFVPQPNNNWILNNVNKKY